MFTLTQAARSVKEDKNRFSSVKTVQEYCVRASPAPSLVVANGLNYDRLKGGDFNGTDFGGINSGYAEPCSLFRPQGNTQLVVRNPALDRLGVTSRETWNGARGTNYGVQNTFNCASTLTEANHDVKLIRHGNLNSRPEKTDFRTAISGPQTSANGEFGRPGKLGGVVARQRYIEKHHGNPNIDHPSKLSLAEVTSKKYESYPIPRIA
jgi:hypothetical protein